MARGLCVGSGGADAVMQDREMEDYWGSKENQANENGKPVPNGAVPAGGDDGDGDVEMGIE